VSDEVKDACSSVTIRSEETVIDRTNVPDHLTDDSILHSVIDRNVTTLPPISEGHCHVADLVIVNIGPDYARQVKRNQMKICDQLQGLCHTESFSTLSVAGILKAKGVGLYPFVVLTITAPRPPCLASARIHSVAPLRT
jgi:hypothetical protein